MEGADERGVCGLAQQIASDGLKGRVFEVSLADLQQDEDQAFRKIKLRAEDVQGKNVLTNFWVCVPSLLIVGLLSTCNIGLVVVIRGVNCV